MSNMFFIQMFYDSLKDAEKSVREINEEVKLAAGSNFKVRGVGKNTMCIAFTCDLDDATLRVRFKGLREDRFLFVLSRVESVIQGFLPGPGWDWIVRHAPDPRRRLT